MPETVTEKKSLLYSVAGRFAAAVVGALMPVRYHGKDKLRDLKGPCVVISNHLHALDPFILARPIREECVFLGKKELAKNRLFAWVLKKLHCILVDRHNTDMEAMRNCVKALRLNKVLVIFPEGTRHHEGQMEQIENGTSLIVLRGRAPLIPVYLDRPLEFFRITNAWVGDPIPFDDLVEKGVNRDTCEELNERMRNTFRDMVRLHGAGEGGPGRGQEKRA